MANWRPVYASVWNDRRFLACGDDARLLWLFLLTCPSLPIPGVIVGGDATLAEMLGWTTKRLQERFAELSQRGLQVEREGRVVWLRNALKYQTPSNPNMLKGWAKKWDDVPEGVLKVAIWEALKIACKSWSILFSKLFAKPFEARLPNGSANSLGNGSTHDHYHQNQNQHENDLEESQPVPAAPERAKRPPSGDHQKAIAAFDAKYEHQYGKAYTWQPKDFSNVKRLLKGSGLAEFERRAEILFNSPPAFLSGSPADTGTLVQFWNKLVAASRPQPNGRGAQSVLTNLLTDIERLEQEELEKARDP